MTECKLRIERIKPAGDRDKILEPYADTLIEMRADKITNGKMLLWLKEQGVECRHGDLIRLFKAHKRRERTKELLAKFHEDSAECGKYQEFCENLPPPNIENLVKLISFMIFKLSNKEDADLECMKTINQLVRTALRYDMEKRKSGERQSGLEFKRKKPAGQIERMDFEAGKSEWSCHEGWQDSPRAKHIAELRDKGFPDVVALRESGTLTIPEA